MYGDTSHPPPENNVIPVGRGRFREIDSAPNASHPNWDEPPYVSICNHYQELIQNHHKSFVMIFFFMRFFSCQQKDNDWIISIQDSDTQKEIGPENFKTGANTGDYWSQ